MGETDAGHSTGPERGERRENPPRRRRPAAGVVQLSPGLARALPTVPPPGDEGARAAGSFRAALPEGAHPPGDEPESDRADSGRAPGSVLPPGPADAAVPSETARGVPQDAGPDLLQAGGPLAGRLAQAEHRVRPGLLRGPGTGRGPRPREPR